MLKGISVSIIRLLLCLSTAYCLSSCSVMSGQQPDLLDYLANQGPIQLSNDNPYLAGNLFLAKKMDSCPDLAGFVKYRGTPSSLEIHDGLFKGPSLHFYYNDEQQYYTLLPTKDSWVINGPFTMDTEQISSGLTATDTNSNSFEGTTFRAQANLLQLQAQDELEELPVISQKQISPGGQSLNQTTDKASAGVKYTKKFESLLLPEQTAPEIMAEANTDIIAEILDSIAPSPAELTPKGDLVHHVLSPKEDISIITHWYTKDPSNAAPIARINQLFLREPLNEGDSIIIPSYFVKNNKRLSEEALQLLVDRRNHEQNDNIKRVSYPVLP